VFIRYTKNQEISVQKCKLGMKVTRKILNRVRKYAKAINPLE